MSEKLTQKDLYKMELFDVEDVDEYCTIRRVPNGWVLTEYFPDGATATSVFIPDVYANEIDKATVQRTYGEGANK